MKRFKNFKSDVDTIVLDVPLFIRLLEFAKEDAPNDMALHFVAEKCTKAIASGTKILTMKDYNNLIKK